MKNNTELESQKASVISSLNELQERHSNLEDEHRKSREECDSLLTRVDENEALMREKESIIFGLQKSVDQYRDVQGASNWQANTWQGIPLV